MKEVIKQITFKGDEDILDAYIVGVKGVIEIICHKAQGDGDKWYYDVVKEDNTVERLFSFESVRIEKVNE